MIQKRSKNKTPEVLELKDDSTRKLIFEDGLRDFSVFGYTIETKNDFDAVITKHHRTNHILHFILLAPTCGFWIFPWIYLTIVNKNPERRGFWVDKYGRMQVRLLKS